MKDVCTELRAIIDATLQEFAALPESEWTHKPNPAKWSKKEVLGHLIDSALNNHRRFIVTQYSENQNIVYHQDEWVAFQAYQQANTQDLIDLWRLINLQIVRILEVMPKSAYQYTCDTGKDGQHLHTLEWLAEDYVGHLKHHLNDE